MEKRMTRRQALGAVGGLLASAVLVACAPGPTPTPQVIVKEVTKVVEVEKEKVVEKPVEKVVTQVVEKVVKETAAPPQRTKITYLHFHSDVVRVGAQVRRRAGLCALRRAWAKVGGGPGLGRAL